MSRSLTNNSAQPVLLWLADGRNVPDAWLAQQQRWLSPEENERFCRFLRPQRQQQFLLGRILVRLAVHRVLGVAPDAVSITQSGNAAPRMTLAGNAIVPAFSISHSGSWVACAVSCKGHVGLDIEVRDPGRPVLKLAHAAFTATEQAWLEQQPEACQGASFYHVWSLREALYKLQSCRGANTDLPLLIDGDTPATHGCGWQARTFAHSALSVVLCADHDLADVVFIEDDVTEYSPKT